MVPVALGLAFGGGLLTATQAKVNGELAHGTGSALWAALVSFGSGLVIVAALVAALPATRAALRPAWRGRLPWWTYLGGLGGATLVAVASAAVPRIGVATFTVGVVAGQAAGGLLVDRSRLSPSDPRPLSATRIVGASLAVLAVVVIRLGHDTGDVAAGTLLALLLASAAAGAGTAVQTALNGRVQRSVGHPFVATLGNFVVGTVALVVAFAVVTAAGAGPDTHWPSAPQLYVGGALGVVYISIATWTVRGLGVLRLSLLTVAGQLAGGLLLDAVTPGGPGVDAATVVGVLLTVAGVALAGRTPRDRPPARPGSSRRPARGTVDP
jgi:bacterial/archaeal transporter family-2 protein